MTNVGLQVTVVAPEFIDDGGLLEVPGIELRKSPVAGMAGGLVAAPTRWAAVMAALRRGSHRSFCDAWLCHWWPTAFALSPGRASAVVLHGSDVDLLERLPRPLSYGVTRWLARRPVTAVAGHLAERFDSRLGRTHTSVTPLGADAAAGDLPPAKHDALPREIKRWLSSTGPRVLTVARNAPGKGLDVAREAARQIPDVRWLILDGRPPVDPDVVMWLVAAANLVVVPSQQGGGLPSEGCPYIIRQALACGTALLGGPNRAVVQALTQAGQPSVSSARPLALAKAVHQATIASEMVRLSRLSTKAGESTHWTRALVPWLDVLEDASCQRR